MRTCKECNKDKRLSEYAPNRLICKDCINKLQRDRHHGINKYRQVTNELLRTWK